MDNTANNAFLVRLMISQFNPRKLDRAATKEAKDRSGASEKAGVKVYKSLLATEALEAIASIAGAARDEHEKRTVPWQYKGPGAITAVGYPAYKAKMAEMKIEFFKSVDRFCDVYAREREEARNYLGDMYNAADYPGIDEIRGKFSFALICEPMPQSSDFRVTGMGMDESRDIKRDMDKRFREAVDNAQANAWERIVDHVEKLKSKVGAYKPKTGKDGKVEGRFHDTLVDNLRELVDLLPSLNITNDSELNRVASKIKSDLCNDSAQELRDSVKARESVAASAEAVLEQVQQIWAARIAKQQEGKAA